MKVKGMSNELQLSKTCVGSDSKIRNPKRLVETIVASMKRRKEKKKIKREMREERSPIEKKGDLVIPKKKNTSEGARKKVLRRGGEL